MQVLRTALAEQQLETLFRTFADAGVAPILGKGWAAARAYPDAALRPYGDFDLYVEPAGLARLRAVTQTVPLHGFTTDLHCGASYLDDRSFLDLRAHALSVPLGTTKVRVFAPEDHLRLVCLHAMAEGVIRPPWLCDIAFMIRGIDSRFDWDLFRWGDRRRTEWAFAAIGLAHQVLGVDVSVVPNDRHVHSQPKWLARTVLRVWGEGPPAKGSRLPMADALAAGSVRRELLTRWPNGIEATVGTRGGINALPRLPYQLADCARRMWGLVRSVEERHPPGDSL